MPHPYKAGQRVKVVATNLPRGIVYIPNTSNTAAYATVYADTLGVAHGDVPVRFDGWKYMGLNDYHIYMASKVSPAVVVTACVDAMQPIEKKDFLGNPKPQEKDVSDWKAWQHKAPGDCPCGIARARCDYHR